MSHEGEIWVAAWHKLNPPFLFNLYQEAVGREPSLQYQVIDQSLVTVLEANDWLPDMHDRWLKPDLYYSHCV